ncbi:hypothetical protein ACFSCV_11665 [Methylopila henanensis]|uniref:Secreted protein n=1 Tax=Methylopila henanensis TaxID=873516 RepID=A0ABW4K983_9HYPH
MKTLPLLGGAAMAAALFAAPLQAAEPNLNTPPPGARAQPNVGPGDLGMALMSAAINADGTIARGEGVTATGTQKLSTGTYEVGFDRDITQCAYAVTVGESGIGSAVPSVVGVTRRSVNPNGVFIQIKNPPDEANEDKNFFVLVYCGR